jgi:hypothetical protein
MKSRMLRWVGHETSDGKPERRQKCMQHNIKRDLEEMGKMSIKYIHLGQDCDKWQALVS